MISGGPRAAGEAPRPFSMLRLRSPEGTVLLPPLPPRVIGRWRETSGCADFVPVIRARLLAAEKAGVRVLLSNPDGPALLRL